MHSNQKQTALENSPTWTSFLIPDPTYRLPESERVVYGAKTLSFCSLTLDRVFHSAWLTLPLLSSPPSLCLIFPPPPICRSTHPDETGHFKMSSYASWCLFSASEIDLSGHLLPQVPRH